MQVYSIKNKITGFFNRPIYVNSKEEALNMIQNILITDKDKALFGLKKDLELYFLGVWDEINGVFKPYTFEEDPITPRNLFVCSLEEIFNSIPEEFLKPALTREDLNACVDKVRVLNLELRELRSAYDAHVHPTKRGKPYVRA